MKNKEIYIAIMERYGNREGHHYILGTYSTVGAAVIESLKHELDRDNKYEMRIEISYVDSVFSNKEIPREVCLTLAKLQYPEKFDGEGNLILEGDK